MPGITRRPARLAGHEIYCVGGRVHTVVRMASSVHSFEIGDGRARAIHVVIYATLQPPLEGRQLLIINRLDGRYVMLPNVLFREWVFAGVFRPANEALILRVIVKEVVAGIGMSGVDVTGKRNELLRIKAARDKKNFPPPLYDHE